MSNRTIKFKKAFYLISSLIAVIASIVAINESEYIKKLFLKPPQIIHLFGKQSVPDIIWGKINERSVITGIRHDIPVRIINNNDMPLKIKNIEIDLGEFSLKNKSFSVNGQPMNFENLSFSHGHLYGRCELATRYEKQTDMLDRNYKDFADFPIVLHSHEEIFLFLQFKLFFNKKPPYNTLNVENNSQNSIIFAHALPLFFGFDGPNGPNNDFQTKNCTIIIYSDYGTFNVQKYFKLPFPGTKVQYIVNGEKLNAVF